MRESPLCLPYTPAEVPMDTVEMMRQATSQAPPTKGGRLWRLLVGEHEAADPPAPGHRPDPEEAGEPEPEAQVTVLRADRPDRPLAHDLAGLDPVYGRVAQLETAMRLLVETLKRVHLDLATSVSELRAEVALTATSVDVRRAVAETMEPLTSVVEKLTETAQALPLALGSIGERVAGKIDALHIDLEESLIALIPGSWDERPRPATEPPGAAQVPDPDFWGRKGS